MQNKLKALTQSRRFWVAVAGLITIVGNDMGLSNFTADQVQGIVLLLATWIVGDSVRKTEVVQ